MDTHHLLIVLKEEHKVSPRRPPGREWEEATEELGQRSEKNEYSPKFKEVFNVDSYAPPTRGCRKAKEDSSAEVLGSIMERIEGVESRWTEL